MPHFFETTARVRYAETDAMGIAHHASYIVWLELGRTELLRAQGMSYRELENHGFLIVLSDLQIRYHAAARYDDELTIRTTLAEQRSRQLTFAYTITLAEGTLLVSAETTHIVLNQATRKPVRLPHLLLELLAR